MITHARISVRLARMAVICAAAAVLTACSILPEPEALAIYRLPARALPDAAPNAGNSAVAPWALRVDVPYSSQLIDSQRILVRPPGDQVSAYKGARWADTGPVLLRNRVIDTFRSQAQGVTITSDSNSVRSDLLLQGDLNEFQVNYDQGAPVVYIQYDATLVHPTSNRAVATRRFQIRQPVQGEQLPEVVSAFGLAADSLSKQLVQWVLQDADRHRAK